MNCTLEGLPGLMLTPESLEDSVVRSCWSSVLAPDPQADFQLAIVGVTSMDRREICEGVEFPLEMMSCRSRPQR